MKRPTEPVPVHSPCSFPYCPFYFDAFFGSDKVLLMADHEIVDYMRLLAHEWKYGHVLNDVSAIAKICLRDLPTMKRHWKTLSRCFFPKPDDASKLVNPRMEEERAKSMEAKRKRAAAARLGGISKSRKGAPDAVALLPAEHKQSKGREKAVPKAAHRQGIALPRASYSLSLSNSSSKSVKGKEGSGKPSGRKRDPLLHKNVEVVVKEWTAYFHSDKSLNTARLWIARRLGLLEQKSGEEVPISTPSTLVKAVRSYIEQEKSRRNVHNTANPAQFIARNFFDAKHNYVFDYLPLTGIKEDKS